MRRHLLGLVLSSSLVLGACAHSEPPPAAAPAPAPAPVASVTPAPTATTPPPAPEPTPEEKKKAEEAKKLADDRAKFEADQKAETARWTPEMHEGAKKLVAKPFSSLKVAMKAVLASTTRKPGHADRDAQRHPAETLEFFGIKPTMTVLEVGPGEGWYTELLAPTLAAKGQLIDTNNDPNGPADSRGTLYGQRFKSFLETSPELYGKVQTIVVDGKAPKLGLENKLDAVLLMREVHGMIESGTLDAWLGEIHKALKTGGIVGIEQHRAAEGADPTESAKHGYVPQKWLIDHMEANGFKLAGKSEINANAKDTKDYPEGVWTLPPNFSQGDKDHAKYAAIGESDRMTLKFVKVAEKKEVAKKDAAKATDAKATDAKAAVKAKPADTKPAK